MSISTTENSVPYGGSWPTEAQPGPSPQEEAYPDPYSEMPVQSQLAGIRSQQHVTSQQLGTISDQLIELRKAFRYHKHADGGVVVEY